MENARPATDGNISGERNRLVLITAIQREQKPLLPRHGHRHHTDLGLCCLRLGIVRSAARRVGSISAAAHQPRCA